MALEVDEAQLRTGSTIILAIVGIWVLTVLSRPINRYMALVIGAMFIALLSSSTPRCRSSAGGGRRGGPARGSTR